MFAIAAIAATMVAPRTSEAKSVMCVSGYGCIHSERSCEHRFGPNYKAELANSFGACVNYFVGNKPTGNVVIRRGVGKPASITIDGKQSRIASGELEIFLDRNLKDERIWKADKQDVKLTKKFLADLQTFLAKDPGISESALSALSRDLKTPIVK